MNNRPQEWLTTDEVLEYVKKFNRHWTRSNLYLLIRNGKLKGFKAGSARFFKKEEIGKCIKEMKKPSPSYPMKGKQAFSNVR